MTSVRMYLMTVSQIYTQFGTPEYLQLHMLRVASLASLLLDSWIGDEIDKKSVLIACLFHDVAKPITFDMSKQEQFVSSDKELEVLQRHHDELIFKYGAEEHAALLEIFKEFKFDEKSQGIVNNLEWSLVDKLLSQNDIESLIPIYADMRISPTGLFSIEKRVLELNKRAPIKNLDDLLLSSRTLESEISKHTSIDLSSISNNQLNKKLEKLAQTEIN